MSKLVKVLVLCAWVTVAAAAEPLDLQPYRDAHARFIALLKAGDGGTPAQLRTPEFARIVKVLSDDARFLRARPFVQDDMPIVSDLCELANGAVVRLMFFGTQSRADPKLNQAENTARLMPLINQNTFDFQAELTTLQPFAVRCLGLSIPLLEEFVRKLPPEQFTAVRRDGLMKLRNGYLRMLAGMFMTISEPRYDAKYRGAVVKAIADATPALAATLTLEQRAHLRETFMRALKNAPLDIATDILPIGEALESKQCTGLCALN
jgi:hypothetical protein